MTIWFQIVLIFVSLLDTKFKNLVQTIALRGKGDK